MRSGGNMPHHSHRIGIGRSEQFHAAGRRRRGRHRVRTTDGRDAPQLAGLVADIDHRDARLVAQPFEIGQDFALARGIERGERLVEQEEARAHQQRAADRDALALAARELARPAVEQMADVEQVDDARHLGGIAREAAHAPAVVEVRRDRRCGNSRPSWNT